MDGGSSLQLRAAERCTCGCGPGRRRAGRSSTSIPPCRLRRHDPPRHARCRRRKRRLADASGPLARGLHGSNRWMLSWMDDDEHEPPQVTNFTSQSAIHSFLPGFTYTIKNGAGASIRWSYVVGSRAVLGFLNNLFFIHRIGGTAPDHARTNHDQIKSLGSKCTCWLYTRVYFCFKIFYLKKNGCLPSSQAKHQGSHTKYATNSGNLVDKENLRRHCCCCCCFACVVLARKRWC